MHVALFRQPRTYIHMSCVPKIQFQVLHHIIALQDVGLLLECLGLIQERAAHRVGQPHGMMVTVVMVILRGLVRVM